MFRRPQQALVLGSLLVLSAVGQVWADESLLPDYIRGFSGRWVCTAVAVQDIEGYWQKGDTYTMDLTQSLIPDMSGLTHKIIFTRGGKSIVAAHGVTTWDASDNSLKTYGFAKPGYSSVATITRNGEKWTNQATLTHPDGSKSSSTVEVSISDDGKTHTATLIEGVDKNGNKMESFTRTWKKVSKNKEVLKRDLGWMIGTWTGTANMPIVGELPVIAEYKWAADEHVIQSNLSFGKWEGLSIILYDPADEKVKMWGANSGGSNGQAVLDIDGDELVWTNTVFESDGTKVVEDFSFIKQSDGKAFAVKYIDQLDGEEKQILLTKQ